MVNRGCFLPPPDKGGKNKTLLPCFLFFFSTFFGVPETANSRPNQFNFGPAVPPPPRRVGADPWGPTKDFKKKILFYFLPTWGLTSEVRGLPLAMSKLPLLQIDSDISRAWSIPAPFYTDPDVCAQENERIFARTWQVVGHREQLAKPGRLLYHRTPGRTFVAGAWRPGRVARLL